MEDRIRIYDFLQQNRLMALATASTDGIPEVATVEYVLDHDNLLINTYISYRKYPNLIQNPQVSCVVTVGNDTTLQLQAEAQELTGDAADDAKAKMIDKEPDNAEFFKDPDTRFFRLTPTWMRLRDYSSGTLLVTEYVPA